MVEVIVVLSFSPRSFHWPAPRFRGTGTGKTSSSPKTYKTGQEIRVKKNKKNMREYLKSRVQGANIVA